MTDQLTRILVADDDPSTREIIVIALETLGGFEVRAVTTGIQVLDAALEFTPQMILLDSMMPDMDGPAAFAQLRDRPETADIPVVFVTAASSREETENLKKAGASGIIPKPLTPRQLVSSVREIWWNDAERDRRKRRAEQEAFPNDRRGGLDAETSEALVRKMGTLRENFRESLDSRFKALIRARTTLSQASEFADIAPALEIIQYESHKLAGAAATFGFQDLNGRAKILEGLARRLLSQARPLDASERQGLTRLLRDVIDSDTGREGDSVVEHTAWNFLRKAEVIRNRASRAIVIVDDDPTLTEVVTEQLAHLGYEVIGLDDPDGLEELAERLAPAMVLMDIVFPDGRDTGITKIRDLHASGKLTCPVVYMSVRGDVEARLGAVRAGCHGYLVKPLDLVELMDLVERLTGNQNTNRFRVLIVDDDINVGQYYAALLSQSGVEAIVLTDPLKCLEYMGDFNPDLVLMDIEMPQCNGFEMANVIRQNRAFVQIPVVFLSASDMDDAWLESLRAGGDEFIRKSAPKEDFLLSIMARLKRAWALRNTVDQLRLSETRFRAVVESANHAIITTDDAGRVIFWNRAAGQVLGYESLEVIGRPVIDLIPEHLRETAIEQARRIDTDEMNHGAHQLLEVTALHKDGREVPAELSLAQWRIADNRYFTAILSDISARKENERQITAAKAEAERAREQAEDANLAKTEFLSSMSHELRTPLNAILGFSQILEEDPLTAEQLEYLGLIHEAGSHLLALIDDVLDLSRIEAGRVRLNKQNLSVAQLVDECLSLVDDMARGNRVSLIRGSVDSLTAFIDHRRMCQVILNLLSNAIKYNKPGGTVTITVERLDPGCFRLSVADTGIGIDHSRTDEVFSLFNRLGAENSNIEGTGIGLHFTRRLVGLMGGSIDFHSEVGQGSRFWIDIPLGQDQSGPENDESSPAETEPVKDDDEQAPRPDRLILYVEDNQANVTLMKAIVERLPGVSLISAPDAEQGIAFVSTWKPDLILMDINLPGMSGTQALAQLRKNSQTMSIPVFALTAAAMPRDVESGRLAGFDHYLTKPIDVPVVLEAIRQELYRQ